MTVIFTQFSTPKKKHFNFKQRKFAAVIFSQQHPDGQGSYRNHKHIRYTRVFHMDDRYVSEGRVRINLRAQISTPPTFPPFISFKLKSAVVSSNLLQQQQLQHKILRPE